MLLLDTHALAWFATDSPKLGRRSRRAVERGASVSAITFWELEMLAEAGRIRFGMTISEAREALLRTRLTEIPVDGVIAMTAARLAMHGDPGDRFIVATALVHGATLMTAHGKIRALPSLRTIDPSE